MALLISDCLIRLKKTSNGSGRIISTVSAWFSVDDKRHYSVRAKDFKKDWEFENRNRFYSFLGIQAGIKKSIQIKPSIRQVNLKFYP